MILHLNYYFYIFIFYMSVLSFVIRAVLSNAIHQNALLSGSSIIITWTVSALLCCSCVFHLPFLYTWITCLLLLFSLSSSFSHSCTLTLIIILMYSNWKFLFSELRKFLHKLKNTLATLTPRLLFWVLLNIFFLIKTEDWNKYCKYKSHSGHHLNCSRR